MTMSLRRVKITGLIAFWLALLFASGGGLAHAGAGRLVEENVASPTLAANLLGDPGQRAVTIYLPPRYDQEPQRRFPVVYLLHGFKAKNKLWTAPEFHLQEMVNDLINRGVIQPLIIVMPDGSNAYGGSFYLNSPVTGNWEDFIVQELVGHIDEAYRTIPQASGRGLAGHSMGGYGALMLALRHPETFGAVYALSPACLDFTEHFLKLQRADLLAVAKLTRRDQFPALGWREQVIIAVAAAVAPNPKKEPWLADLPLREKNGRVVLDQAVWETWLQSDPATLLPSYQDNLSRLKLALDMGTADRMLPQVQFISSSLKQLGIPHTFEEYDGDHGNRLRERLQTRALPFLAGALQ